MGSGFDTVGSAVASDSRVPGFESSRRQLLLNSYLLLTVRRKDKNKKRQGQASKNGSKTYDSMKTLGNFSTKR